MSELYKRLSDLCESKGVSGYKMCKDCGLSPSTMTDLKSGRKKTLTAEKADKVASYFNVTVAHLLGTEEKTDWADVIKEHKKRLGVLSDTEYDEIVDAFTSASPELRAAALAVLRSGEHKP